MKKFLFGALLTEVGLLVAGAVIMKKMAQDTKIALRVDLMDVLDDFCENCPVLDMDKD